MLTEWNLQKFTNITFLCSQFETYINISEAATIKHAICCITEIRL